MSASETLPSLSRFTAIFDALLKAVGFHAVPRYTLWGNVKPIAPPILALITARLYRTRTLFLALAARYRAGTLRTFAHRSPSTKPRTPRSVPAHRLPRHFSWLYNLVPGEASIRANHLRLLLAEPDMQELLAASPRARAILKPVCNMLGIEPARLTQVGSGREAPPGIAPLPHPEPSAPAPQAPTPTPSFNPSLIIHWQPPPSPPDDSS